MLIIYARLKSSLFAQVFSCLSTNQKPLKQLWIRALPATWFLPACYVIAVAQILLLTLGIFFLTTSHTDLHYIHQEHNLNEHTIYVHTVDPGAMAKAYHYVYLKCPLAFNRYALKKIGRLDWMREFRVNFDDEKLVITQVNSLPSERSNTHIMDISAFTFVTETPQVL
ncbi:hypothetical protein [Thalassotalea mangrovi]|uniref:Uncharacterized protein n=1 Tax=Thalassotalea mangrovi TaxID=2572245 RepID=A0A4U1BA55_9GAMM|nr:hypothetical protein [Thalassotalea mangrovi]TKB47692.1 hypothetical protein E8M12_00665 [Thalassotalea mangrovi]